MEKDNSRLRNYAQVDSLNRLSDPDIENMSTQTAGEDTSYINRDTDDRLDKESERKRK